jgi:anhydro-N-acetylmuramic acid kinase
MGLKEEQIFLGIMSGTSCDGLDLALVGFKEELGIVHVRWIAHQMISYNDEMRLRLIHCSKLPANELARLENDWTNWVSEAVITFLAGQKERPSCIGFHGHTVFHRPELGYTYQMGSGATLSAKCAIDVVADFRQQDVARGGQGAPLVPVCERDLFPEFDAFLNLGGFANATIIENSNRNIVRAFDVCGANLVLNRYAAKLGFSYDVNGDLARKGNLDEALLKSMFALNDSAQTSNKQSLGVEWLESIIIPVLDLWLNDQVNCGQHLEASICGLLSTYTDFIAAQCGQVFKGNTVLVSGGGAHNTYLMERLRANSKATFTIADKRITDFKEALAFAYLAYCRINLCENTLVSVTGANQASIAGAWYKA